MNERSYGHLARVGVRGRGGFASGLIVRACMCPNNIIAIIFNHTRYLTVKFSTHKGSV